MADTTTTKILEVVVDNNKAITAISEYNRLIDEQKKKQTELAQSYKDGSISQADYYKGLAQSKEVIKTYSRQVQELSKEVQNNIKMDTEKQGSLRALRAELSNVTKQYDALSEEERQSAKGFELKDKINSITSALKGSEEATGRFYRNVGNYAGSLSGLFGGLSKDIESNTSKIAGIINTIGSAIKGTGTAANQTINPIANMRKGFMALSATPIITILGALVTIIQKVIQNLKSSEASMQAVAVAMAPLNAAGRVMQVVMQKLGEGIAKVVTKLTEWADKLGLITDAMKVEQQLVKDEIALQMREREVIMQNADSQLKVSQLKAQAADKLNYSAKERVAFLESALAEEDAIAKRELELAKERYRIQEEQSKLAENSTEENDELVRSYAAMRQAETDYFNKSRELTAQLVEAKKQMAAESKAAGDASIEAAEAELTGALKAAGMTDEEIAKKLDLKKREVEARLKLVEEGSLEEYHLKQQQLQAEYEIDMQRLANEEGTDELIKLRREEFTQEMTELETQWAADAQAAADALFEENLKNIEAEQAARLAAFEEQKQQELAKQQLAEDSALAFSTVAGSVAGMLQTFGEENKELARLSKVIALAQIAIETGVATAKGISSAMSVPFPANLAAIATTIATIIGGMASAISTVKSAKFATGGYVSGPGTGTSDSIPARLSNGESVINARSTAMFGPLLSSLNQAGGGVAFNPASSGQREGYEFLAAAVASGMKSVDIRVAVDEIATAQDNVNYIKAVSTLG